MNLLKTAKKRIDERQESEAKEYALSVYFEDLKSFINHYTAGAKEKRISLGSTTDLHLNKLKNRLFDCVSCSEINELLIDCAKAKNEFFNKVSNLYENQYKKEFNFFSFKEQTNFDWTFENEAIANIKYYLEYRELYILIDSKLIGIENRTIQNNGLPISNTKPKKIAEKWHALHYWLELTAHGKKTPVDCYGSFEKSELEQIGAKRCNSTGQGFYREFTKIDINNPIILKRIFGNEWKSTIIKLCENDIVTVDYINLKYK